MQRRATWIVVMAAVAVLAAVLVLPRTASANYFVGGRCGAIQLAWNANLHPGAIGHVGPYFRWMSGTGTLGVPNSGGLRTRTTWWPAPGDWRWHEWRLTIADNATPLPADRVFFSYTYFPAIRLDLTPPDQTPLDLTLLDPASVMMPGPMLPADEPKEPPVVVNEKTVNNALDENFDADTVEKYKGLLEALNGHNAPPP